MASSTSKGRRRSARHRSRRSTSGPGQHVVVDLEGVESIDSAGLGVLLGGLERARGADGGLALVATGQSVIKVLELTGLTRVFEIYPSRTAALGAD
jgi:anti-sigma B factor antagonist